MKEFRNPVEREDYKSGKLEYAYEVSGPESVWPIYGSLLRAIGKGWNSKVVTSDSRILEDLSLLDGTLVGGLLEVLTYEEFLKTKNFSATDLWLGLGLPKSAVENLRSRVLGTSHLMVVDTENEDSYDLISKFEVANLNKKGVVAITGDGKGKTTSALGKSWINLSHGKKVAVVQWFKEFKNGAHTWAINEHKFPDKLANSETMKFFPTGLGFYGSPNLDRVKGEEAYLLHRNKAYEGLGLARKLIESGEYSEVVLDELVDTVKEIAGNIEYPLIDLTDLKDFLDFCVNQDKVLITVTGRRVTEDWDQFVSKSIVVLEIKHPWSSKKRGAVSGLDF